jgi:hypothetical protein
MLSAKFAAGEERLFQKLPAATIATRKSVERSRGARRIDPARITGRAFASGSRLQSSPWLLTVRGRLPTRDVIDLAVELR